MDPDVTLEEILEGARKYLAMLTSDNNPPLTPEQAEAEIAKMLNVFEGILNLDAWLTHGGFLPERWTNAHNDAGDRGKSGL